MEKVEIKKRFEELERRMLLFAKRTSVLVRELPRNIPNTEYGKQVVRSAGSVGANYIEANNSLSKKDFLMRIKICRKEAKETQFWLQLILPNPDQEVERQWLQQECLQLIRILGTIFKNATTG